MIKKILIIIFFIVSSASPLFACETEKIKKKCYSQRAKNMELEMYQTTIGMTQAFLKQAACITRGINDKFDERYDGEKWHYHDHWNPNIHITPTKSAEMFTKLLHIYYETYIEMEQAKGNGTIMYIQASADTVTLAHQLLDQMYEYTGNCPLAISRRVK